MLQAGAMNLETSFTRHASHYPTNIEEWKVCALAEVALKKERLHAFYMERGWASSIHTYQYLSIFKPVSLFRKNGYQPAIIHELDIGLTLKALYEGGYLPERITHSVQGGEYLAIPEKYQPVVNIFNIANIHDVDEDFGDSSPAQMLEALNRSITNGPYSLDQMAEYISQIDILPDLQRAITFGRKMRDEQGNIIKVATHNDDPQVYFDALQRNWATMLLKAIDRTRGIVDRYCAVPNIFPWERQRDYLAETHDLFYLRRPMENMKKEYPELKEAIGIINARMEIAYRATSAIVSFHPDNPSQRKTGNPATARLDIRDFLDDAMKIHPYLHPDDDDLKTLLHNLEFVTSRRPELFNITKQLREQLTEAMPELASQPAIPGVPLQYHTNEEYHHQ